MQAFTLSHGGRLVNPRVAVTNDNLYDKAVQTIERVVDLAIAFGKENVEPTLSHMRNVYSKMKHAKGGPLDWKQVAAQKLQEAEELARQGKDNRLPISQVQDLHFLVHSYASLGLDTERVIAADAAGGKIAARQRFEKLSHMSAGPRRKSPQVARLIDDISRAGGAKAAGIDAERVMKFGPVQRLSTFAALSGLGKDLEPVPDSGLGSEPVSPTSRAVSGSTAALTKV